MTEDLEYDLENYSYLEGKEHKELCDPIPM